jgi:hypothetical protein
LAGVGAGGVDAGVERGGNGLEGFEREGGNDVGGVGEGEGVDESEGEQGGHEGGAVGEGEAFFGEKGGRGELRGGEGFSGGEGLAEVFDVAESEHGEGHVREGGKIAAGADGTLCGDDGVDGMVEHVVDELEGGERDARVAEGEGVGASQHGGADDFGGERVADARRVAHDEVFLELGELVEWDYAVLEGAEAGSDAVDEVAAGYDVVDDGAGGDNALLGFRGHFDGDGWLVGRGYAGAGHPHEVGGGEVRAVRDKAVWVHGAPGKSLIVNA